MSEPVGRWQCRPDDGTAHVEAAVEAADLTLCFWRCEADASVLEATLGELGLSVACEARGPCVHEDGVGAVSPEDRHDVPATRG